MSYLYMDGEWNGCGGELISLALVPRDGEPFYEVLGCDNPNEWVAEHVMPKLEKQPISIDEFIDRLKVFLYKHQRCESVTIVADWPEDIAYFCNLIVTGPGERIDTPMLFFEVYRVDPVSKNPHNALADAVALRDLVVEMTENS